MPELVLPIVVGLIVFLSALINGAVGFGFALIGVLTLAFVLDPRTVVIVLSVVTPALSVTQVWHHREYRGVLRRLGVLLVAGSIGCIVGTQLLVFLPTWALSLAMGLFAMAYVLITIGRRRPPLSARVERALGPFVGFLAGTLNGAIGASGPILGPYLHAIGLHTRAFGFAISSVFTVMALVRIASIAALGAYTTTTLMLSALIVVPAIVGQQFGFALQRRIDHRRFEVALLAVVGLSGINLLVRGIEQATVR